MTLKVLNIKVSVIHIQKVRISKPLLKVKKIFEKNETDSDSYYIPWAEYLHAQYKEYFHYSYMSCKDHRVVRKDSWKDLCLKDLSNLTTFHV